MSSSDSRIIFIATKTKGLWKTLDGGQNWENLSSNLGDFGGSVNQMILSEAPASPNTFFLASQFGLLKTSDSGVTWEAVPLLTPPRSTVIYSLAVSPKNSKNIYYGTATTFYRSVDGGLKWIPSPNPTSRAVTRLYVDSVNDNNLYIGTTVLKQKRAF